MGNWVNPQALCVGMALGLFILGSVHDMSQGANGRPSVELVGTDDDAAVTRFNAKVEALAPLRAEQVSAQAPNPRTIINQPRPVPGRPVISKQDAIVKANSNKQEYVVLKGVCFPGGTFLNLDITTVDACAAECKKRGPTACTHWSLNTQMKGQACRLKFTASLAKLVGETDSICVSGKLA
eukprot:m.11033 g.11033  ORF g.11033 m.11033 type:complete len:181 (-) comp7221_c0_seq1:230-772(-)